MPMFQWNHHFSSRPEVIWPLVSDMQRMEEAVGMPAVEFSSVPTATGETRLHGETRQLGMRLKWHEKPFEWVAPHYYRIERVYPKGPLKSAVSTVTLAATANGTQLLQTMQVEGRNVFGNLLTWIVVGWDMRRQFLAAYRRIDEQLAMAKEIITIAARPARSPVHRARLKLLARRLASTVDPDLAQLIIA